MVDELVMFAQNDVSGLTRGRSFPARQLEDRWRSGVGWVPADQALTPLGPIAEPNPWGPIGDLRLIPDPSTEVRVASSHLPPLHFVLCDITHTDGSPWDSCLRTFAKNALEDLRSETGLGVVSAFEHEFHLSRPGSRPAPGFTLEAQREAEPFLSTLQSSLDEAGLAPEMLLPEYGEGQFEVTVDPASGITGADRAVSLREVVRDTARALGCRTTFTPIVDPTSVGNGVHVHFSLVDQDGHPALYEDTRAGGLSELGGWMVGGILKHLPSLLALTAPSPISYLRLVPHRWSAAYIVFGEHNREAAVRIAPLVDMDGRDAASQYNLEYRAADATASPYLVLGAIVRAGLEGIRTKATPPTAMRTDPGDLSDEQRAELGIERLPTSLEAALAALEADEVIRSWFSDDLWDCYLSMKRTELRIVADLTDEERCARYAAVY